MISILFENEELLVVDKPEGIATIPERQKEKDCLLGLVSASVNHKLYVVHRLDKEVSGVLVFAKHAAAHKALNEQFNQRTIHKTYMAVAHGVIERSSHKIDVPIRQFGSGRMGIDHKQGKPCITEFSVTRRFEAYTLVKVHPLSGRRHQIRVHFYSIGHPLVGDLRYGEKAIQSQFPRLLLHAHQLTCRLLSGEEMTFTSPLPVSFRQVMETMIQ
ncbi:pseudouridine synthase [Candidatus Vecturithrix granuli]|uniref:Pseudouridine synthase n=1 Tax=Vecturithrix granuli TaxID=1499967 RepID=A0A081C294_VECG1|nr:pseudouridine synthase [Candidatus Vecturithrix granuli]